jgi:hypothetical protein
MTSSTLNWFNIVKNFAGTRLMGNFSLKRSQWKNAGHALSSEMHEFAVDCQYTNFARVFKVLE